MRLPPATAVVRNRTPTDRRDRPLLLGPLLAAFLANAARSRVGPVSACCVIVLDKGKPVARRGRKAKGRTSTWAGTLVHLRRGGSLVAEGMRPFSCRNSCTKQTARGVAQSVVFLLQDRGGGARRHARALWPWQPPPDQQTGGRTPDNLLVSTRTWAAQKRRIL